MKRTQASRRSPAGVARIARMPATPGGRYALRYAALMAALPLHLIPVWGILTWLLASVGLARLYRVRARETGQAMTAWASLVLWLVFGIALLVAINGRSTDVAPLEVARLLIIVAVLALGISGLCSVSLWRGWYVR